MNPSQLALTSCYVPLFLFPFTDTAAASLPPRTAVRYQVPPGEGFPLAVLLFVLAEPAFNFYFFFFAGKDRDFFIFRIPLLHVYKVG